MTNADLIQRLIDVLSGGGSGLTLLILIAFIVWMKRFVERWTPEILKLTMELSHQVKRQNELIEDNTKSLDRAARILDQATELIEINEEPK